MRAETKSPEAGAAASRAGASMPVSTGDERRSSECALHQQARYILRFYELSLSVALVVAEHAYGSGRGR
jgi:hypothetical protein